jgi:uncharacterized hydrophobic protein (TIGR00341 family)
MAEEEKQSKESVLWASFFEQKNSLEKLIEESRADSNFYFFLSISSLITTLGLLTDNVVVVIGGMLVAPLLYPILSLSMGITTSNLGSIVRSLKTIGKSVLLVLIISILTSIFFGAGEITQKLLITPPSIPAFFLVAFAAGLAAALAWVRQNLSASLPGVAVAVALIPPLAAMGISIPFVDRTLLLGAVTLFIANLFGISLAALIIFSLFGFSRFQKEEKELIQKEEIEQLTQTKTKLDKTKEKLEEVEERIEEVKEKQEGETQEEDMISP